MIRPPPPIRDIMVDIPLISIDTLIDRYAALLFDAYGVLVHRDGPLPGAREVLTRLHKLNKPFFIVTNSAARLPERAAARYQGFGLPIEPEQLVTSGALLKPYFAEQGLLGRRFAILGPRDTYRYVELAGADAVPPGADFDGVVIGDQVGFPFLEAIDAVLSRLFAKFDRGESPPLILPNPDLVYPKSEGFGITSGAVALIIQAALRQRYPDREDTSFIPLGKPAPGLFAEAVNRAGARQVVMIGDQIDTDIQGACRFGIDSALISGGVAELAFQSRQSPWRPTYRLAPFAIA